jgi:hypothetical protein
MTAGYKDDPELQKKLHHPKEFVGSMDPRNGGRAAGEKLLRTNEKYLDFLALFGKFGCNAKTFKDYFRTKRFREMVYCAFILNRMSSPLLDHDTPYFHLHQQLLPDISMIPVFTFYQEVYYQHHASSSEAILKTREALGHFVGFAEHVGHSLTYKILTSSAPQKVHFRSKIRAANDGEVITGRNLRADKESKKPPPPDPPDTTDELPTASGSSTTTSEQPDDTSGRPVTPTKPPFILQSPYDKKHDEGKLLLPTINPEDIIGKSFKLPPTNKDGSRDTATFTEIIQEFKDGIERHPDLIKFKFSVNDEVYDNLVSYSQALEYLSEEDAPDELVVMLVIGQPVHRLETNGILIEHIGAGLESATVLVVAAF